MSASAASKLILIKLNSMNIYGWDIDVKMILPIAVHDCFSLTIKKIVIIFIFESIIFTNSVH